MTLGQKLKQTRLARGMTQSQVVGDRITRNMLSQIENDLASPSVGTLEYLASVLNVRALVAAGGRAGGGGGRAHAAAAGTSEEAASMPPVLSLRGARAGRRAGAGAGHGRGAVRAAGAGVRAVRHGAPSGPAGACVEQRQPLCKCSAYAAPVGHSGPVCTKRGAGTGGGRFCGLPAGLCRAARPRRVRLAMARYQLERGKTAAAEAELRAVPMPPEESRAEYRVLQARLASASGRYAEAMTALRQAERTGPLPKLLERELLQAMELAARELQDYKTAYECAARQLKL